MKNREPLPPVSIRLDADQVAAVDALAGRERLSRNATFKRLVDAALGMKPGDPPPIPPGENHDAGRPEHVVEVPILTVASGGPPMDAEQLQGESYQLLRHLYRDGRYVIRLSGESMYPHFWSGDLLLVEPAARVKEGAVAVVKVNGESTVKRVFKRKKGGWILKGDNPMFPPIDAEADEVEVVGKVLKIVDGERP